MSDSLHCTCHSDDLEPYCPRHTPLAGEDTPSTATTASRDLALILRNRNSQLEMLAAENEQLRSRLAVEARATRRSIRLPISEEAARELIGRAIREYREAQGWSQAWLAEQVGRQQNWLSRIETGQRWFSSASEMCALLSICGLALPWQVRL